MPIGSAKPTGAPLGGVIERFVSTRSPPGTPISCPATNLESRGLGVMCGVGPFNGEDA